MFKIDQSHYKCKAGEQGSLSCSMELNEPLKRLRLIRIPRFHRILCCRKFKNMIIPPAKKKLSLIVQWTDRTCPLDLILWEPVIWNADFICTNDKLYEMILTFLNVIYTSLFRINSILIYPRHILRIIGFSISKQSLERTKNRSTVSKKCRACQSRRRGIPSYEMPLSDKLAIQ